VNCSDIDGSSGAGGDRKPSANTAGTKEKAETAEIWQNCKASENH